MINKTELWVYTLSIVFLMILATVLENKAHALDLTVEVGAYYNMDLGHRDHPNRWENNGSPVAAFKLRVGGERIGCEVQHISNWTTGAPFNDELESSLDIVGCTYRLNLL